MTDQVITFTMPGEPEIKIKIEPTPHGITICGPDDNARKVLVKPA